MIQRYMYIYKLVVTESEVYFASVKYHIIVKQPI